METLAKRKSSIWGRVTHSPYAALALLCVLCHGLLLLCDYKIWDGWMLANWEQNHRFDVMQRFFSEAAQPHYYYHRLMGTLPQSVWLYKFVSVLAYLLSACAFFHLMTLTKFLSRREALLASAFMLTFPGALTLGDAAVFPYIFGMALSFVGACVVIHAELHTGGKHVALRLLGCTLLFLGFTYYAMLVFYAAFYLLFLWFLRRRHAADLRGLAILVIKRADYLLLPIVFWGLKLCFIQPHGHYANYNQPRLDITRLSVGCQSLLKEGLISPFLSFSFNFYLAVIVIGGAFFIKRHYFRGRASWHRLALHVLIGFFLLFLAGLPFISVGRTFASSGYGTNYSVLLPVGAGFILAALVEGLSLFLAGDRLRAYSSILMGLLLISFITTWNRNYLHWQALGARDQSVANHLRDSPVAASHFILHIQDDFRIPLTDDFPMVMLAIQMQDAFGDRKHFAFRAQPPWGPVTAAEVNAKLAATTIDYFFEGVDPDSPQALVTIRPGPYGDNPRDIALTYLNLKWNPLSQADEVQKFLDGLTRVEVRELPGD
jgi:hypothetical protein